MIATSDGNLAARLRRLRVHGIDIDADIRHRSGVAIERYAEPGYNYRMTDIQAAIGRAQLAGLPATVVRRRELARRFAKPLAATPGMARFPRSRTGRAQTGKAIVWACRVAAIRSR
jgi:dTDP-4-amino-4,6-dideoxygalactose transaminase